MHLSTRPDVPTLELTRTFSAAQYAGAFESWSRLALDGKTPLFCSLFGDVFLEDGDGHVWFLDSIEGTLERLWSSGNELGQELRTEAGQDRYLLAGLAFGAHRRGLILAPDQVYDLMPPPVLGGPFAVENLSASDFVVTLNIRGQLHEDLRDVPAGTPLRGVRIR